jgi:hypothetical protein
MLHFSYFLLPSLPVFLPPSLLPSDFGPTGMSGQQGAQTGKGVGVGTSVSVVRNEPESLCITTETEELKPDPMARGLVSV